MVPYVHFYHSVFPNTRITTSDFKLKSRSRNRRLALLLFFIPLAGSLLFRSPSAGVTRSLSIQGPIPPLSMTYYIKKNTNLVEPNRHIITKIADQNIYYHPVEAIQFCAVLSYHFHHILSAEFTPISTMDTASQRKGARGQPL